MSLCTVVCVAVQGIPSHQLLTELTEGGDPGAVMAAAIAVSAASAWQLHAGGVWWWCVCGVWGGGVEGKHVAHV
jgi:hypothetical protein